jgi:hypothetical protein
MWNNAMREGAGRDFAKAKSRVKRFAQNVCPWAAQGIAGARSVLCAERKEWSEAEPRKARFFCRPSDGKKMRPNSSSKKFLSPHP